MEQTGEYHQFATVLENINDRTLLHVYGDVDMSTVTEFESAIADAADDNATVIVDLTDCRYMDSTGLTGLIRAVKQFGKRIAVEVLDGSSIERIMKITDFHRVVDIASVKRLPMSRTA